MVFELPVVDPGSLARWCEVQLGSPVESELFRTGHLARVIGTRLADGREVIVRVRPAAPRIAACAEVQRRLFDSGYPCPRPLAGPAPLDGYMATAESYIAGGAALPDSGRVARPFAAALAQLVRLAPRPAQVPALGPAPAWAAWNHDEGALWPRPEDLDVDLNQVPGPGWLDAAGRAARQKLQEGQARVVIGHSDWITDNLRWHGGGLLVAYDWDSLIADSEAVIAGLAAATYLYPALPATTDTRDFLDAYATARGLPFSPGELQRCWAAGVWTRAFDATQQHAAGKPVTILTQDEASERLRQAGMC
ncbi:MAG TPA: phosphotransferase [Streptosporangiaceae bacterium]|nr:phosphotransferase [Streptosporangiaceae bacterium]